MAKGRSTIIVATGAMSVGSSGYADPEHPIHITSTATDGSIAPAVGRQVQFRMNKREAEWIGKALIRYALTPEAVARDIGASGFIFTRAFDEALNEGVAGAVKAGEQAVSELNEQRAAYDRRRQAERVTVIEDSTANGFDPEAYGR